MYRTTTDGSTAIKNCPEQMPECNLDYTATATATQQLPRFDAAYNSPSNGVCSLPGEHSSCTDENCVAVVVPLTGVGSARCHSGCTDNSGCGNGLICHVRQSNLVQNDWTRTTTTTIYHDRECHRCSRGTSWWNRWAFFYGSHRCHHWVKYGWTWGKKYCFTPSPTTTVTQVDNIAPCPVTQEDLIAAGVNSCPRTTIETGNPNEAVRGCSGNPAANTNYCVIPKVTLPTYVIDKENAGCNNHAAIQIGSIYDQDNADTNTVSKCAAKCSETSGCVHFSFGKNSRVNDCILLNGPCTYGNNPNWNQYTPSPQ